MIAFVQPFGLHSPGGGPRILRSLLTDSPYPVLSVCTALARPEEMDEREVHLPIRPYLGQVEHTRLAWPLSALTPAWGSRFKRRLSALFVAHGVTCVHAIPHGLDFWYAFEIAQERGLPYVLTVHDDMTYNLHDRVYLRRAMDHLATVWRKADGRTVISAAMGEAYCERYGSRPYEVVTDGLTHDQVADAPRSRNTGHLNVYFMGSVHLSYQQNFQGVLDALNIVSRENPHLSPRLTIRGGLPFDLQPGDIPLDVLGWGTQAEVERDLETADLLYFPLPFAPEHDAFVRLSLSTKLVTYLGSGIPILYHGPEVAAAAQLLTDNDAGLAVSTLDARRFADVLDGSDGNGLDTAVWNALDLARRQFMLDDQRSRFWKVLSFSSSSNLVSSFA